jgi:hypothetical protein
MGALQEKVSIRAEIENSNRIILILPKAMCDFTCLPEAAHEMAKMLELLSHKVPGVKITLEEEVTRELAEKKMEIGTYLDKYVVLRFEHTDRLSFSAVAAIYLAKHLRRAAQRLGKRADVVIVAPNWKPVPKF